MNITKYGVVLFLHIGFVIVGFMLAAILHACLHSIPRAKSVGEMRAFAGLVHRLEPLLPFTALVILGLGAWLLHLSQGEFGWSDGWVLTSLITLIAIEALAGSLLAPRSKKLVAMIEAAPDGDVSAELRRASLDPMIWDLAHIATFGFLGVVFVMADKPSGGMAVLIVLIGAALGVALSRWQLSMAGGDAGANPFHMPGQRTESAATSTSTNA